MSSQRQQDTANAPQRPKRSSSIRRLEQKLRPHVPTLTRTNSTRLVKPEKSQSQSSRRNSRRESTGPVDTGGETGLYATLLRARTLRKMPKTTNLSINVPGVPSDGATRSGLTSPRTPLTPRSPPPSGGVDNNKGASHYGDGYDSHIHSPINALPPPPSPRSPKPGSVTAKIFGNKLASKSATKLSTSKISSPSQPQILSRSPGNHETSANASQVYLNANTSRDPSAGPGQGGAGGVNKSSPDLVSSGVSHPHSGQSSPDAATGDFSPEQLSHSNTAPYERSEQKRKTQHKFGNFLNRKSSLRGDETVTSPTTEQHPELPPRTRDGRPKPGPIKAITQPIDVPVRTAPVEKERGFRSAMNSAMSRNRSLDREDSSERISSSQHSHKPSSLGPNGHNSSVMSNLRSGSTRAAEGINKARKGLFGGISKMARSGSSHERDRPVLNEPYELKVLVLPLEEQARITRIAKRLHYCKDKTEFWLPAFPYRCIDYLSDRGTYSEGLYRVPGSELEIKHYMARFDREHDIDLFDQPDLHDVNVVATMLKRWLSNLPPVLPPDIQQSIISTCSEPHPAQPGGTTPPFMKDALSNLPPWNYYLLFAITGHISFLHNHREQNKMTYENLFRCFATRALQVEPYIFWWLVWDWRGCWAGCSREDEYKIKEYEILDKMVEEDREQEETQSRSKGKIEKKDSKEDMEKRQRKASKHSVSALSKQSVPRDARESKSRPQTAHGHSRSEVAMKSQPPLPSRQEQPQSRSRERAEQRGRERERERELAKAKDNERAISSSESSKPSITGQSSAGMTDKDEEEKMQNGHSANGKRKEEGDEGKLKSTDMGLPMLSPLKPLSPLGLH